MGDALDQVRKRLWNQARREGDKKTTGTMRGLKYALLKNPDDCLWSNKRVRRHHQI